LQLTELKKQPSPEAVKKQLHNLPKGLDETYDQILMKIDKAYHNETKTFLQWLSFAARPMSLEEIAETVTVDFESEDGPQYKSGLKYWNKEDVLKRCSGLVTESEGMI
jgi:hypothetical protein